jgi:hypothetical protein
MQVRYQAALRPDEIGIISERVPLLPTFRPSSYDKIDAICTHATALRQRYILLCAALQQDAEPKGDHVSFLRILCLPS